MKKLVLVFALLVTFTFASKGQEKKVKLDVSGIAGSATKSEIITVPCQGFVNPPSVDLKWRPLLTKKNISFEPKVPNEELIEKMKEEKLKLKNQKQNIENNAENATLSVTPIVGTNYLGNKNNGGAPLDNSMAISNGGWIVSVANTTIEYDNTSGSTIYYNNLISFINDATITNVCDPVVIYDISADRFIFFCQTSPVNANSKILIFFSKTNNPTDGWWAYKISGNPMNNGEGFDYPKLAVSTNELYITGNLFFESSGSFDQAILYQITKSGGYSGGSLSLQYWHTITGNPFTLLPVSYGQGTSYGPGCYLIATDNAGSSNIKLYDLTDDMTGSPALNLYNVSTSSYSPASNSSQLGTTCTLDNGDCRALSGFYLNGVIHFVFHSDIGSGWNGINYNRLAVSSKTNVSSTFGSVGNYDYSYPSVASFTTSPTDMSVMINFGRANSSIYPEERVVNCDNSMGWSGSTLVKSSNSYVSCYGSNAAQRWGDYTGISRKHNSVNPSVWITGSFGNTSNEWDAWNAEIHATPNGINLIKEDTKLNVFPNPVVETFNVEFTLHENTNLIISIIDISGKVIKELFNGAGLQGNNYFSFNKANLSNGTYFLVIKDNKNVLMNEKIIISN